MAFIGSTVVAAETSAEAEVLLLRKHLEELKAGYIRQAKAINILESRLRQVEGVGKAPATKQTPPAGRQQQPETAKSPTVAPAQQPPQTQAKAKEEKVVKEAPRSTSVNTIIQEEHGVFGQNFSIEVGSTYSRFSRAQINLSGFLALDAIFLGRISVDEVTSDVLSTDLTVRYGLTDRIQLDFNAPFLYRNSNYFVGNVNSSEEQGASSSGEGDVTLTQQIGDVNMGIFYQVHQESVDWPDIVWNLRVKAPTGTDPYGIGIETLENGVSVPTELPSGNGVWAFSTGFSFVKTVDPAVLFANINFFHNFEGDFDNIGGQNVFPGTVDLGNAYQFGLGMAFALNERLSMNFSYTQRFTDTARIKPKDGNWNSIIGSDANIATLNMGVTFALTQHLTVITNVGIGLTTDAPDVQLGIKLPYQF